MNDNAKTRAQLIEEINTLHKNAAAMEGAHQEAEDTLEQLEVAISRANKMAFETENARLELNQIFDTVADGMCLINKDFILIRINAAFSKQFETTKEEALGKHCFEVIGSVLCKTPDCPVTRILNGKERVETDVEQTNHKGKRIPCILTATAFRDLEGYVFGALTIFKDITERKQAEEERIQREKLQGIIEMAGAVCHELNQPLQVVSGYSEILLLSIDQEDPLYTKVKTVKEQIEKIGEITKKLIGTTRYETKDYLEGKIVDIDKASGA